MMKVKFFGLLDFVKEYYSRGLKASKIYKGNARIINYE